MNKVKPAAPEVLEAIRQGVYDAFVAMITPEALQEALAEGVAQAVWSVACADNNGSPSVNFYESLERGIENAISQVGLHMLASNAPPET